MEPGTGFLFSILFTYNVFTQVPQQYIMYPGLKNAKTEDENENEDLCIYPLHSGITFSESDVDRKKSAQERIKSLYKKASKLVQCIGVFVVVMSVA